MFAASILKYALIALFFLIVRVTSLHLQGRDIDTVLLPSYDYIIVGGGISGLVVGNRLSEDPTVSVLVIEAGNPDNYEEFIQVPQFVGSDIGGKYDWNLGTAPQTFLDGQSRTFPQGKVLGGGSILNAMVWNRGGADDFDSWERLGNPGWGWEDMLPYFKKSEKFTPVSSLDTAIRFSIKYEPSVHGFSGPVQVSYPKYFYNQSINFFSALAELGVVALTDPNDGMSAGAAFCPTDIDPINQTRSDARRAYYDPYVSRSNFHVLTGQLVTRINIAGVQGNAQTTMSQNGGGNLDGDGGNGGLGGAGLFGNGSSQPVQAGKGPQKKARDLPSGLRITGVEFAPDAASRRLNVSCSREVILAAGALHSPQILQLSGIGPRPLLESLNIPVAVDLPGVGNNLQDHCLVGTFYPYNNVSISPANLTQNATFNEKAREEYYAYRTGPWTAGSPNGLAFPSLSSASLNAMAILQDASNQGANDHLVPGLDPAIIAGYAAQKASLVQSLSRTSTAAWEIINNNIGSLTVAVMHPFSRGTVYINSTQPFHPPTIDPRYGSNPIDLAVLMEGLRFNRRILTSPAMAELLPAQFVPPANANATELMSIIKDGIRTEYHPSGTNAMLPREQGGVVDPRLRVYGTQNLRVVDAGIFPLIPAAHLQANVYAVAEKAADLIKADNSGLASSSGSSVSVSSTVVPLPTSSAMMGTPFTDSTSQMATDSLLFPNPVHGSSTSSVVSSTSLSTATMTPFPLVPTPTSPFFSFTDSSGMVIPIFTTVTITLPAVSIPMEPIPSWPTFSFSFPAAFSFPFPSSLPALAASMSASSVAITPTGGSFHAMSASASINPAPFAGIGSLLLAAASSASVQTRPPNADGQSPASAPSVPSISTEVINGAPRMHNIPNPATPPSPSPTDSSLPSTSTSADQTLASNPVTNTSLHGIPPQDAPILESMIAQVLAWMQNLLTALSSNE